MKFRFSVVFYLNAKPGARLRPTDVVVPAAPGFRLAIESASPHCAAEVAYKVGNGMLADIDGNPWPKGLRHLANGDLMKMTWLEPDSRLRTAWVSIHDTGIAVHGTTCPAKVVARAGHTKVTP